MKLLRSICDEFSLYEKENVSDNRIKIIGFTSRTTGEHRFVGLDVFMEMGSIIRSPYKRGVLLNLLANEGFYVSTYPNALEEFFHLLHFPTDPISPFGVLARKMLPRGVTVGVISTLGFPDSR